MHENDTLDEICISFDIRSKSLAFYNVATKNRIRYNQNNYHNLMNAIKYIDEKRPIFHWPRRSYPLKVFIDKVRYLNGFQAAGMSIDQREKMLKDFWEDLWNRMPTTR